MSNELIKAIDLALAGDWEKAHQNVQKIENEDAYWIHAVLHKIEGDMDNSRYWYSRAGKMEHFGMDSTAELQLIKRGLAGEKSPRDSKRTE
jgi:hypothetical protein